jgi:hypothetical protein
LSKRRFSGSADLFVCVLSMVCVAHSAPFTIVVLPDTQYYSARYPAIFTSQTQWILNNQASRNIAFVLHEGDLTDTNTVAEWQNASTSMGVLDGKVPYIVVPGNHDYCVNASICGTPPTLLFDQYFPPSRYVGMPDFGGVFEAGKMDNSYHLFSAGGTDWLVIGLEWGPRNEALAWADSVVNAYPNRRVMVVTHTYLYSDDTLQGSNPAHVWLPPNNNGVGIWNNFIRKHRNIEFVFNGHIVQGCPAACTPQMQVSGVHGAGFLISTGDNGNKVYQFFANYQEWNNKDTGLLRILTLDPSLGTVKVETYSPYQNWSVTDVENSFQLSNVDMSPPSASSPRPPLASAGGNRTVLAGDPTQFNGSASVDPDGRPLTYQWNFGDGTIISAGTAIMTHTYTSAGTYSLTLTVNDGLLTSLSTATVTVLGGFTMFVDDFNGGDLSRWTVVDEATPSNWKIVPGGFLAEVNGPLGGTLGNNPNKNGTYVLAGSPSWTNYTISARWNLFAGNAIGVVFRYQDINNYYVYFVDLVNGPQGIIKRKNGVNSILASATIGGTKGEWDNVQVQVSGSMISVTLNGTPTVSAWDPNPISAGRIGLYGWASPDVYFDDVVVTALGAPGLAVSRVNVGGPAYTDPFGAAWSADPGTSGGVVSSAATISGTTNQVVYQTEREMNGSSSYTIPLPNGPYWVNLKFADLVYNGPYNRRISVQLNGSLAVTNLDVVGQVGALTALDWPALVNVTSGVLTIQFGGTAPELNGFEVFPTTGSTSPPLPPTNLHISNVTTSSFQLSWSSAAGVTDYRVDIATDSGFANLVLSNFDDGASTTTTYGSASPQTSYWARVRSYDPLSGLYSSYSNVASATTPAAPPVITSPTSSTGVAGSNFTYQIAATNSPTSFNATGLPGGLSINTANGAISGIPTTVGTSIVTLSATDAGGTGTASLTLIVVSSSSLATVGFLATDTATQGNWKGVYGADGFAINSDSTSYPAYAQVTFSSNTLSYIWANPTSETRALLSGATNNRLASTWYASGSFSIDVNLTDGKSHQIALYVVDWEHAGRTETINVRDTAAGVLLDSHALSGYDNGQYWVWNVKGHVTFTITNTNPATGQNAIVSGIFFGGAGAPPGISVSPASGSGTSQTFTFNFPSVSNVDSLNMIVNSTLTGTSACYFIYETGSNTIDLVDDSGTTLQRLTPGGAGTLSNSQCSIVASSVLVTSSGGGMTVVASVNFASAFAGSKTIWASWYSGGVQQGSWLSVGSWTVTTSSLSVSPSSGSGTSQTFTFNFPSVSNVDSLNMIVNSTLTGTSACYFIYETGGNTIDLVDDSGTTLQRLTPGGAGTLSNSQCSIVASSVLVTSSGGGMTVVASVNFASAFAGSKTIWASWYSGGVQQGSWLSVGSWTVTASPNVGAGH